MQKGIEGKRDRETKRQRQGWRERQREKIEMGRQINDIVRYKQNMTPSTLPPEHSHPHTNRNIESNRSVSVSP